MGAGAAFGAGFAVIEVFIVDPAGGVFVVSFCVVAFCAIAVAPASANTAAARKELRDRPSSPSGGGRGRRGRLGPATSRPNYP
jgi:hypothetical protein